MSFSAKDEESKSSGLSRMFVSEDDVDEYRRKRQEEWERIRKPDDPLERPETVIQDSRSLYERLQEQKDKKQEEWEEQHKFKNLFRGIDGEESDFLDQISQQRLEENKRRFKADTQELLEFKNAVSQLQDTTPDLKKELVPKRSSVQAKTTSQAKLLAGSVVLKRKSSDSSSDSPNKKPKNEETETKPESSNDFNSSKPINTELSDSIDNASAPSEPNNIECSGEDCGYIWGGLAHYSDSSDSDSSSSDSDIISTKIVT